MEQSKVMAIDPRRSASDMAAAKMMYQEVLKLAIDIIMTAGFGWGIPDETQGWLIARLRESATALDSVSARNAASQRFMGAYTARTRGIDIALKDIAKTLAENPPPAGLTEEEKIQSVQAMAEELCAIKGLTGTKVIARRAEKTNNIEVVFL